MLKVVIDTNVIVSALNFGGKPREILDLARSKQITNITSQFIINEVSGVLTIKFLWEPHTVQAVAESIKAFSECVDPLQRIAVVPSCEADNRIIECALEGRVRLLISGDRHLTGLGEYQGIKIYDPATFLQIIS